MFKIALRCASGGPFNGHASGPAGTVFVFLRKLADEATLARLSEGDAYSLLPRIVGPRVAEGLTNELLRRETRILSYCSAINWFIDTYAREQELHVATASFSRCAQDFRETPSHFRQRLEGTCGLLWDTVRVSAQFIAGVSPEARSFILGANPPLTAESDPVSLIAAAEAGDIGRRNRTVAMSRTTGRRESPPPLIATTTQNKNITNEESQVTQAALEQVVLISEAGRV
jgi:hypothetical protein